MTVEKTTPEALKPYSFHGLEFSINGTQAQSDCPFCDGDKFFISKKTGQYDCKSCGCKGNKVTFLSAYHKLIQESRTEADLKKINKLRGNCFTSAFLADFNLCLDAGDVLFPIQVPDKKYLSNLRKWHPSNKVFYNTPSCSSLFFARWEDEGPIYICEGEWDALALLYLMKRAKYETVCSVVAVPGANTFKDAWVDYFSGKDVILLYDNDHDKKRPGSEETFNPGKDGMVKVTKLLEGKASSIKCIDWTQIDDDLSDGYDIRDHLMEAKKTKKSKKYLRQLLNACAASTSKKSSAIKTLKRETFEEVVKDWKDVYEFNQSFEDVLACCFATLISLFLSDRRNPLWLFIVAPPSSGKTTIIEGFKGCTEYTEYLSELTPAALVTGLKMDDDYDPSLLQRANEKVWFIEDFTPILSQASSFEIFGVLRAAYNGFYDAHFATHIRSYEDLHFAVVSGVTHAIERVDLGDLGERFLRVRLLDSDFNEDLHIETALNNVGIRDEQRHLLLGGVNGFIDYLMKHKEEPVYDHDMNKKLISLAKLCALLRTSVHRDKTGLTTRPVAEVASRIATQLKKLGIALGVVYGRKTVNEDCYRVMQKVAFDTCVGWSLELVQTLSIAEDGLTTKMIANKMNIHINQVRKIAENAMQLNIVEMKRVSNNTGRRGAKATSYVLTKHVQQMIKGAGISFGGKRSRTTSKRTKRSRK